jgi:uncharacterized protein (TIGR03086 family)
MNGSSVALIDAIEQAWHDGASRVSGLRAEQLANPTPCAGWNVEALLHHVLVECRVFTDGNLRSAAAAVDDSIALDRLSESWADAAAANIDSWRQAGLSGERTYPFGTFPAEMAAILNLGEVLVHTWDLAVATGQELTLDPRLATIVDSMYRSIDMTPYRGVVYEPEIAVPATASAGDRLLALLGRQP